MEQEKKKEYSRRITTSNPSQLICIWYEMYFSYEEDALEALRENKQDVYVNAIRNCSQVVEHLRSVLDFQYSIAGELFALYTFVETTLAKAMYRKKEEDILNAGRIMKSLQEAFGQVEREDTRDAVMKNTQKVTVGLTYGRNSLNESIAKDIGTRGYWV